VLMDHEAAIKALDGCSPPLDIGREAADRGLCR